MRLYIALAVLLLGAPSLARPDRATQEAKRHYLAGKALYDREELKDALLEYEEAFRLKPLPGFLFNMAQCYRKLGNYQRAIDLYQQYLEQDRKADRATIESLIAESEAKLAESATAPKPAPSKPEPTPAAAPSVATTQPSTMPPPPQPPAEPETPELVPPPKLAAPPPSSAPSVVAGHPHEGTRPLRRAAFAGMGVGAAALVGGLVATILANSAQSSFDNARCGDAMVPLTSTELSRCRSDKQSGEAGWLAGDSLLAVGGAVLGTSIIIYLVERSVLKRRQRSARATLFDVTSTPIRVAVPW